MTNYCLHMCKVTCMLLLPLLYLLQVRRWRKVGGTAVKTIIFKPRLFNELSQKLFGMSKSFKNALQKRKL